ncbi:hypothetical protein CBA19C6_06860 [Cupriavidus pauculus]|nr:hypothetical protein CBA19C6_06860 [Cupriavidus pauculus]
MTLAGCGGNDSPTATQPGAQQPAAPQPETPQPVAAYAITGSVSGLSAGQSVTLMLDGANPTVVNGPSSGTAAVPFSFGAKVQVGNTYVVTVSSISAGSSVLLCPVTNGQGTVATNVNNITVDCHAPQLNTLHVFSGSGADGIRPTGRMVADAQGTLYGTTQDSIAGYGTVFSVKTNGDGTYTTATVYAFTGTDGSVPTGLAIDSHGNLFGTTQSGGANGYGTVFELKANGDGTYTMVTLHSFADTDGSRPTGLTIDSAGNLFGTTSTGGSFFSCMFGCGTVFKLQANGDGTYQSATTLYAFEGAAGSKPAGLMLDGQGNLYGVTTGGNGTAFRMQANGDGTYATPVTLHAFTGMGTDGNVPTELAMDAQGNLFGTTQNGGTNGSGTAFKLKPNGDGTYTTTTLYSFSSATGATPLAGLTLDAQGNLFGTTSAGGASSNGVVFELKANGDGTYTSLLLYTFTGAADGSTPNGGLVVDSRGNMFGTTMYGGSGNRGTVFRVN